MKHHQSGKLLFTSLALSVFLHLSLFTVISFTGNSTQNDPDSKKVPVYKVSLDYNIPVPENNKKSEENERGNKSHTKKNQKKITGSRKTGPVQKQDNQVLSSEYAAQKDSDSISETKNKSDEVQTGTTLNKDNPITGNEKQDEDLKEENYETLKNILYKQLNMKIQDNIFYPPAAKKRNIEGTVTVLFILDRQGYLVQKSIGKSSGNRVLDRAAISLIDRILHKEKEAVKLFNHFLPYPHMLDNRVEMKLSISYYLE